MAQNNAEAGQNIALVATLCPLALVAVILRFVARSLTKARYAADDWLVVVSLLSVYAYMAASLWATENGLGYELAAHTSMIGIKALKGVYIADIISPLPITAAKFSILYLYRRIFYNDRNFQTANTIVGALCLLWFLATTTTITLQCIPVRMFWNRHLPGKCFDTRKFLILIEIFNSLLDFVIVALPMRVIKGLHLPVRQKIQLYFIFVLGGFVGVIGFMWISMVYKPNSETSILDLDDGFLFVFNKVQLVALERCMMIQLTLATVCACLPVYRPLLQRSSVVSTSLKTWYSSMGLLLRRRQKLSASGSRHHRCSDSHVGLVGQLQCDHCANLSDGRTGEVYKIQTSIGRNDGAECIAGRDYPLNKISVRNDVELV